MEFICNNYGRGASFCDLIGKNWSICSTIRKFGLYEFGAKLNSFGILEVWAGRLHISISFPPPIRAVK